MAKPEVFVPNEQLRYARNLKGWTQAELAEQVGTSFEIVSRWERGITIPSPYFRKRLCTVLGKTAEELGLLGGSKEPLILSPAPFAVLASSHADEEKAIVTSLKKSLQAHGTTVLSSYQISRRGGEDPQKAMREAIRAAQVIFIILSPEARASRHIRQTLTLANMYECCVYGIWIEGEDWQACLPKEGVALSVPIDARNGDSAILLWEVTRILAESELAANGSVPTPALSAAKLSIPVTPRNPYKGLQAFHSEDQQDFFGRESLVEEFTVALKSCLDAEQSHSQAARLLTIIGPSGSGKSSLVLAGLLPELRAGKLHGSDTWVYLAPIVPGARPVESLALTLAPHLPHYNLRMLHEDLESDSARGLHHLATALIRHQETRVVLFVDQFEEIFSPSIAEEERQHFIDLLTTAMAEPHGPVIVILTLRADFSDWLMHYPELYRLFTAYQKAVLPMETSELRAVIERPAALPDVQLTFEGGLVGDLLFESQGQPGSLPLLEFTLTQLFAQRHKHALTLQAYHELGGIKGALTRHAEKTYAALPSDEHRQLARALFLRLIQPGVTEQDTTRRRASLPELQLPDPHQTLILEEVARLFITARLLTADTGAGIATVEVSHEAVIREWPRLATWLRGAREDIRLQQTISQDAAAWERHGKTGDHLYRGSRLRDARRWAARNTPSRSELAFLKASARQRVRFVASVLAVCFLVLALATVAIQFGLHQSPDATHVTNLRDDGPGSLRWAIGNAPVGSSITVDETLRGKTIELTSGNLQITRNLQIQGPVNGNLTISSAGSLSVSSIIVSNNAAVTILNVSFKGTALNAGDNPGISNFATLTLMNSTISGYDTSSYATQDTQGGGITNHGRLTLINSTIEDNQNNAGTGGGGILNLSSAVLTLIKSTVSKNKTTGNGGGILNCGTLTVTGSTIEGNSADEGGGIFNCGTLIITSSTLSDNRGDSKGGGLFLLQGPDAQVTLTFCTIFGNSAASQGGGVYNDTSSKQLVMSNSIVASNTSLTSPDIAGPLISSGYNLVQDSSGTVFDTNKAHATDITVAPHSDLRIDPQLSGRLPQIHALLAGSPAIDKIPLTICHANGIDADQRGVKRPDGHEDRCDIGAYEYSDV